MYYMYEIRILCIKMEINQGYTTMHGQPIIKNRLKVYLCKNISKRSYR
jgi:hypothetical protein